MCILQDRNEKGPCARLEPELSSSCSTNLLDMCGPLVARLLALGTGSGALVGDVRVVGLVGHDGGCLVGGDGGGLRVRTRGVSSMRSL